MDGMSERSGFQLGMGDLRITVEGQSKDFWHEDLHTRATVLLTSEADFHGWGEERADASGDYEDALYDFSAAVLSALASRYAFERDLAQTGLEDVPPDALTLRQALQSLLEELDAQQHPLLLIRVKDSIAAEESDEHPGDE